MNTLRIIPRLDIKGPNVIKGIFNEGLRVVGSPQELAEQYYRAGADEIVYMDVVASLYQRNLDFDLLKSVANRIFVPLTVGGGIRSLGDINNALRAGADKVAINTYAIKNPDFLEAAARKFGSQCVVLAIEAKQRTDGGWEAYTDGGRERTGVDVITWIKQASRRGIGEIIISSVDREGLRQGFDLALCKAVASASALPLVVHGGAGDMETVAAVLQESKPDAVAIASAFHYGDYSVKNLKNFLSKAGLPVRPVYE